MTENATASIVYLMKNYADYNLWANSTLVNWLKTKPEDLLEKEVLSSFPSIKLTLVHIYQTQVYWLSVLRKEPRQEPAPFAGTVEDIFDLLRDQSAEFTDFVAEMGRERIEDTHLIVNPWFECNFQNFEYIMQVMNHSTYHRGQIVTMGRNLGFTDAPMTDYNYYNVMGK